MCQSNQRPVVGFIGLGVMGGPMAGHLSWAGHALRLFDVAPGRAPGLAASIEGARAFDSAVDLAPECEVIVTMVPNDEVVHSLIAGDDGLLHGLAPGALLLDTSSCEPWLTERSEALLATRGVAMVDASVSGVQWDAEAAELVFKVGGATADVERVRPLLEGSSTSAARARDMP